MAEKLDFKKTFKELFTQPPGILSFVDVPSLNYLMIDGWGNPNTSADYQEAVSALYSLSYGLKFAIKKIDPTQDYSVAPLEGLWWMEDMREFSLDTKDRWEWTMMILQPETVTPDLFDRILTETQRKKPSPALEKVRLEHFHEGLSVQILHIGPYAAEKPTIDHLHAFIHENDCQRSGKHHEIYLGDPRRTAPEKLRTILRQPVERN